MLQDVLYRGQIFDDTIGRQCKKIVENCCGYNGYTIRYLRTPYESRTD